MSATHRRSTSLRLATHIVLVLALAASGSALTGSSALAATATRFLPMQSAPFAIFNDTGKRDRFEHLLFLAETAKDAGDRGRKYRDLGAILQRTGRRQEALRAYEAGALQGDGPSASIVVEAVVAKRYTAHNLSALVGMSVLPKAQGGNIGAQMLLADLVGSGKIKGAEYHTSGYWLDKAARYGSGRAQRELAEAAEQRGDIAGAAAYYAMLDNKTPKLDRALRQAKTYYLGKDVKPSTKIGIQWLAYAARLDANAAGKLAAKLVRTMPGSDGEQRLIEIAEAAGISNTSGSIGPSAKLAAATTPEARQAALAELRSAAEGGDGNAAIVVWKALTADAAPADDIAPYLLLATKAGSAKALSASLKLLVTASVGGPQTDALLAAVEAAAGTGDVDALKALAYLYAAGGPVAADQNKSIGYFQQAADQGDLDLQFRVGLYFAQDTVAPDAADLARHYLEAAATQGSVPAKAYLDRLPAAG